VRIRVIDAFTDRAFRGNPAAVCLLDRGDWPDERWMQQVASEMNLSETAFAHPLPGGSDADWALRWFTPTVEVDLCGHATLATAHALSCDGRTAGTIRFGTRSGILIAHSMDGGAVTLDFPAAPTTPVTAPNGLAEALNAAPEQTYRTGALSDLLAVFSDEASVRDLAPDFSALARVTDREGIRAIVATAGSADPDSGYDFVSRCFAPAQGIPEDPVTGSAHTALAPYWARHLGRSHLTGLQVSTRTGLVHTAVHGDRVHLTGHACTVLDGTLCDSALPPRPAR
jgi:PhzF family phenazine biosynthesis protein